MTDLQVQYSTDDNENSVVQKSRRHTYSRRTKRPKDPYRQDVLPQRKTPATTPVPEKKHTNKQEGEE